jgi:Histidine kinase-, DNA gyrase B-, and HSP90-like ATPase
LKAAAYLYSLSFSNEAIMANRRKSSTLEVIPSARRLVLSLRDVGYDFVHAVADLVDNSIAAGASLVDIDLHFDGRDSWLRIVDNGRGMSGSEITEAVRYGSQKDYDIEDLGKFGLGLKTASMSQCRRLSVASRPVGERPRIEARQLDLDHIERSDRWEVFVLRSEERPRELVEPLTNGSGTVVLWEQLDRVLGYKVPWGERAKAGLLTLAEQLELHLSMVFHRFLAGEISRRPKFTIRLNGVRLEPWDPFARKEKATEILPPREIEVSTQNGVGIVRCQPYVLPPRERFSREEEFNKLGGPARWNAQQGFYIYRSNRMIQSGGWCRLRTFDEHTKLARIALDFFPDMDSAFEINVAKTRVILPSDLRDRLKGVVDEVVSRAQKVYRQASTSRSTTETRRSTPPPRGAGQIRQLPDTAPLVVHRESLGIRSSLEAAATSVGESHALSRIIKVLQSTSPEVARALGW